MQTFLPFPDFEASAKVLDDKRLGNQRRETWILVTGGWPHHPASKMWRRYEMALILYGLIICLEWRKRGHSDFMFDRFHELYKPKICTVGVETPWWFGGVIHVTHQSNLVRKNPLFYGPKFPGVSPNLAYYWPKGKQDATDTL